MRSCLKCLKNYCKMKSVFSSNNTFRLSTTLVFLINWKQREFKGFVLEFCAICAGSLQLLDDWLQLRFLSNSWILLSAAKRCKNLNEIDSPISICMQSPKELLCFFFQWLSKHLKTSNNALKSLIKSKKIK